MFKFMFSEMTETTRRSANNFKTAASLVTQVLFAVSRIKSKRALRNTEYEGA